MIKETTTREAFGQTYITTYTYEYDDHGYITKEVLESDDDNYIMTFENSYDANDNISLSKETYNGQEASIEYYFWSLGGHTAIKGVKAGDRSQESEVGRQETGDRSQEGWYTLQGQRVAKPSRKGIYIHNGKLVLH